MPLPNVSGIGSRPLPSLHISLGSILIFLFLSFSVLNLYTQSPEEPVCWESDAHVYFISIITTKIHSPLPNAKIHTRTFASFAFFAYCGLTFQSFIVIYKMQF